MITDAFISIGNLFLQAILAIFNGLNMLIPDAFSNAITYLLGTLKIFTGIFPVSDLFVCLGILATTWVSIFTIRIVFMFTNGLPVFGTNFELPSDKKKK